MPASARSTLEPSPRISVAEWDIASAGDTSLVVWTGQRWGERCTSPVPGLYAARVAADGTLLDAEALVIVSKVPVEPLEKPAYKPKVIFNGTTFVVGWETETGWTPHSSRTQLRAARISLDGSVLDPGGADWTGWSLVGGQELATDGRNTLGAYGNGNTNGWSVVRYAPDQPPGNNSASMASVTLPGANWVNIASDGTGYLAVGRGGMKGYRLDANLQLLSPAEGFAITSPTEPTGMPSVLFTGSNYLVAWQQGTKLAVARVTPSGDVLSVNVLPGLEALPLGNWLEHPVSLALAGEQVLLAWQAPRADGGRDARVARLTREGALVDAAGVVIGERIQGGATAVRVAANGTGFSVLWRKEAAAEQGLLLTRVGADGSVSAAQEVLMRSECECLTLGTCPLGVACTTAATCASGSCVDGVCCDSACGGGKQDDCQVCSVEAGAAKDGQCGPTSGNACNDALACTAVGTCRAGTCDAPPAVTCVAPDSCHEVPTCGEPSGTCGESLPKPDGSACEEDGKCKSGVCFTPDDAKGVLFGCQSGSGLAPGLAVLALALLRRRRGARLGSWPGP